MMWHRGKFAFGVLLVQIVLIIIYAVFVEYDSDADASDPKYSSTDKETPNSLEKYYPLFQDVNVMIFIGFGFLMTFLRKYSYSAVGINLLLGTIAIQWALIMQGLWDPDKGKIRIHITKMINANFATATVLISFGAVLGKASPLQLLVMTIIELAIFGCNEHLGVEIFKAADIGGSIFLHTYGAYFGLAVAFVLYRKEFCDHSKEGSTYQSDISAMIGTVFLWMFWPSFNAALGEGQFRHRAVINTWMSLAACSVTTFAISSLIDRKNRINMVHIQNATLAGGVAIGASADMMTHPYGAMIIGVITAVLCTIGYHFLTPLLAKHCRLHDTCGVNNLHGMPGIFAGIISAIMALRASEKEYRLTLYELFPARTPGGNSSEFHDMKADMDDLEPGEGRSAAEQATYQLVALGLTLLIAIIGGLVTGMIMKLQVFDPPNYDQLYEDGDFWEIPEEPDDEVKPYFNRKDEDSKGSLLQRTTVMEPTIHRFTPVP